MVLPLSDTSADIRWACSSRHCRLCSMYTWPSRAMGRMCFYHIIRLKGACPPRAHETEDCARNGQKATGKEGLLCRHRECIRIIFACCPVAISRYMKHFDNMLRMLPVPNVPHCKIFKFGAFVHELKVVSGIRYPDYPPKNRGIRPSLGCKHKMHKIISEYLMPRPSAKIERF